MSTWVWRESAAANLAVLRLAALLVPRRQRSEWLAEWRSELWYVPRSGRAGGMAFTLGAFPDAVWLRRHRMGPAARGCGWLKSPVWCVALLAALAAAGILLALGLRCVRETARYISPGDHLLMLAVALLVLPATTPLSLGEFPAAPVLTPARRSRRWIFLGVKTALLLSIAFCGTLDLAPLISPAGIQPHAMLAGYVLAFRWALVDQRRRCPVCLRRLAHPTRIGQPSRTFLEWYGTEFLCERGHGLLHVPETSASYCALRWVRLDATWSNLFS